MNPFLAGFTDELEKAAGVLGSAVKRVGGLAVKHPWEAILGATTVLGAGARAASAYKSGLEGGERPRYLSASVTDGPSPAAFTNYNQLFERPPTPRQTFEQSRFYRENAFKR